VGGAILPAPSKKGIGKVIHVALGSKLIAAYSYFVANEKETLPLSIFILSN
jgi:hypothetical protein